MNRFLRLTLIVAGIVALLGLLTVRSARATDCLSTTNAPGCAFGLPTGVYNALLPQMQVNMTPNVQPIAVDYGEIKHYSHYKKIVGQNVSVYNGPDGDVTGTLSDGFSWTNVLDQQGDWAQISPNQWVATNALSGDIRPSAFVGVVINRPTAYPWAWIIASVRPSALPGDNPAPANPIIYRYTRVNLFATLHAGDWDWFLIGPGQWVNQRNLARVLPATPPGGVSSHWVSVDLYEQVLTAYDGNRLVFATLIASGLPQFQTRQGLFSVYAQLRSAPMSGAEGQADYYNLPAVPYVMYFDNDISFHGTYWHDGFGYRHSHGCVNMSLSDAHWLYDWADKGTSVYVWRS